MQKRFSAGRGVVALWTIPSTLLALLIALVAFGMVAPTSSAQVCPFPFSYGGGPAPAPGPGPGPGPGPTPPPAPAPPPPPAGGGLTPSGGGAAGGSTPGMQPGNPNPGGPAGGGGAGGGPAGGGSTPTGGGRPGPAAGGGASGGNGGGPGNGPTAGGGSTPRPVGVGPAGPGGRGLAGPAKAKKSASVATWDYWWNLNKWEFVHVRELMRRRANSSTDNDSFLGEEVEGLDKDKSTLDRAVVRDRVIPTLRRALTDRYHPNREAAIIALGKTGDPSVQADLLSMLKDADQSVQESATLALGLLGQPAGIDSLIEIVRDSAKGRELAGSTSAINSRTRQYAAFGLGMISDPRSTAALLSQIDASQNERDLSVFVVAALGMLGDRAAVPDLCKVLSNPAADATVRAAAAVALGKLGDRGVMVVRRLEGALADKSGVVVQGAASALGYLARQDDKSVIEALARTVDKSDDVLAKAFSLMALGRIGGRQSYDIAAQYSKKSGTLSGYAPISMALSSRGSEFAKEARAAIHQAAEAASDPSVRAACYVGLGLMGSLADVPPLMKVAEKGSNEDERAAAVTALGIIGDPQSSTLLEGLLGDDVQPEIRHEAAMSLALMGRRSQAITRLVEVLEKANNAYLRAGCALALGLVGDGRVVGKLAEMTVGVDTHGEARSFAAGALGLLSDQADVPLLYRFRSNNLYYLDVAAMRKILLLL